MIEIDGSLGEGGGQILRTSMTLSAITGKPVRIKNIRKNRNPSGIRPQHLTAIKAVRSICRGILKGAEIGSEELEFYPGKIVGGKYEFNIGTAGSVVLVAQTILPILLFKGNKKSIIWITGGTDVKKAPNYDYFENVFLEALRYMGGRIKTERMRGGYYPRGGGEIKMEVEPSKIEGKKYWPRFSEIEVIIRISRLPLSIAIREKKVFVQEGIERIRIREENALDPGNSITAYSSFRGAYVLGEKGKRAEIVAKECLEEIKEGMDCDVDRHLADQIMLYGFIAEGKTEYTFPGLTKHIKTNYQIIKRFLDRKSNLQQNKIIIEE